MGVFLNTRVRRFEPSFRASLQESALRRNSADITNAFGGTPPTLKERKEGTALKERKERKEGAALKERKERKEGTALKERKEQNEGKALKERKVRITDYNK